MGITGENSILCNCCEVLRINGVGYKDDVSRGRHIITTGRAVSNKVRENGNWPGFDGCGHQMHARFTKKEDALTLYAMLC